MVEMQRLFVAVELAADVRAVLESSLAAWRAQTPSSAAWRWVDAARWHFTLQFLGSVDVARVPQVGEACRRGAETMTRFELGLGGAGAFPSERKARVVWIGARAGGAELAALAAAVQVETRALGFVAETRPYHAHSTLARVEPAADVRAPLRSLSVPAGSFVVEHVVLFRSRLAPGGARHEPLQRHPLGTAAT